MKHGLLILTFLFLASACGDLSKDEERYNAIHSAYLQLHKGDCEGALETLNSAPQSDDHAKLIQTISSAHACKAGYSTIRFFGTDILTVGGATSVSLLGDLATFSTSALMTTADDDNYEDLQVAINTLLYAGGIASTDQPTVAERQQHFDSDDLGDIHSQLAYMVMVQLGMFMQYYGNIDTATGEKGAGGGGNNCLYSYDDVNVAAAFGVAPLNGNTGSCSPVLTGHVDMTVARACRALVNFNVLFELLPVITADLAGTDFGGGWQNLVNLSKDDLSPALIATVGNDDILNEYNEASCITSQTVNDQELEFFFAFIFEQLFL